MQLSRRNYSLVTVLVAVLEFSIGSHAAGDTLSAKDKQAVQQFYGMVKDDLTQPIQHEDLYLIRWIRAKNYDLKAAEQMLRENLEWRKLHQMDNIFNENFDSMRKRTVFSFTYDHEGRAALTASLGMMDVRRIVLAGETKLLDKYIVYGYEMSMYELLDSHNKTGKRFENGYLLFNMAGYAVKTHACLGCIPSWAALVTNYEYYYPQLCRSAIIVNVPRAFITLVDNVLRPLMTPHTAKNLRLYDFNSATWTPQLFKLFPENELLLPFGGTLKAPYNIF